MGLVDSRAERRSSFISYGTRAASRTVQPLAVEVGLRYLPVASAAEGFRPFLGGTAWDELYPAAWRGWVDAELLRLFDEEEELLFAAAQQAAGVAATARETAKATTPRVSRAVRRVAKRLRRLSDRVDRIVPGLSAPLREASRTRLVSQLPEQIGERVWWQWRRLVYGLGSMRWWRPQIVLRRKLPWVEHALSRNRRFSSGSWGEGRSLPPLDPSNRRYDLRIPRVLVGQRLFRPF